VDPEQFQNYDHINQMNNVPQLLSVPQHKLIAKCLRQCYIIISQ